MEAFQLREYIIEIYNQHTIFIHYPLNGKRITRTVPLLEMIGQHLQQIENQIAQVRELFTIFALPDLNMILDNPDAKQIIDAMPRTDIIPGEHFTTQKEIDRWNKEQIIETFNSIHGSQITYEQTQEQ